MREKGSFRADAPGSGHGFVETHVGRMRRATQGVQHDDVDALDELEHIIGDIVAVAEVRQPAASTLFEEQSGGADATMREIERGDVQVPDGKRPGHLAGVGGEVPAWGGAVEGIRENPPDGTQGGRGGVDRDLGGAHVAVTAEIVHAHDVVGVGVSDDDGVQPADVLAQGLEPEFGAGIDHHLSLFGGHVDRRARPMVSRVGEEFGRVVDPDDGNAHGSPGSQERELERHRRKTARAGG